MVHVIKDTADIYRFLQKLIRNSTRTPAFHAASVSSKQIEKFLRFSFKTVKISLIQNPDPRANKVGRKPDPPGSENMRFPGARSGGGEWSGLELTDT